MILSACAERIILSAHAESIILSVHAESIILSAGGAKQQSTIGCSRKCGNNDGGRGNSGGGDGFDVGSSNNDCCDDSNGDSDIDGDSSDNNGAESIMLSVSGAESIILSGCDFVSGYTGTQIHGRTVGNLFFWMVSIVQGSVPWCFCCTRRKQMRGCTDSGTSYLSFLGGCHPPHII